MNQPADRRRRSRQESRSPRLQAGVAGACPGRIQARRAGDRASSRNAGILSPAPRARQIPGGSGFPRLKAGATVLSPAPRARGTLYTDAIMAVRIVRLGSPRKRDEGVRIGTVRRPPRGVSKERFAADDWYDVWLPTLAPSAELVLQGRASASEREWADFARRFRKEMNAGDPSRVLDTLAALSHQTNFSVGCYCEDEQRCHRSVLRELFAARGASIIE